MRVPWEQQRCLRWGTKFWECCSCFPEVRRGREGKFSPQENGCDPDEKDLVPWSRLVFVYMNKSQSFITEMFCIKPLKTVHMNNIKVSQSFELDHCFLFWQNLSKQTAAVPFLTLPEHFSLGEHFLKFTFGSFLPISLCLPGPSHRDSPVPYLPVAMSPTLWAPALGTLEPPLATSFLCQGQAL